MITDGQNMFSKAQAVTATAISANVKDAGNLFTGNLGADLGTGEPLFLFVKVDETMDDTGDDSTVTVTLETDDNVGLTSAVVLLTLPVFAAVTPAGTWRRAVLPPGLSWQKYIGLRYTVANGDLSAGKFTAGIVRELSIWSAYASALNFA